jgi:hypothetical protein
MQVLHVESRRVYVGRLAEDLDPLATTRLERERLFEQREGLVDLVPAGSKLDGAAKPTHGLRTEIRISLGFVTPGEVDVLGPYRFGVVPCQQCCVVVATASTAFDPGREVRVHAGSVAPRQRPVSNLARKRVLEHELPFAGERRVGPTADEVALLEQPEVRLDFNNPCRFNSLAYAASSSAPAIQPVQRSMLRLPSSLTGFWIVTSAIWRRPRRGFAARAFRGAPRLLPRLLRRARVRRGASRLPCIPRAGRAAAERPRPLDRNLDELGQA